MDEKLETLFHEALSRPVAERTAFLREACGQDEQLRREVQALIDDSNRCEAVFGAALGAAIARMSAAIAPPEGASVGPFKLVRRIGEGGMGVVFLATREQGGFDQQVAIKFVQGGPELVDRFRHERRILASLDHPNIARLLDGGATTDNVPYLVMEYIEGRPLLDYCREGKLSIRERLLLFEQVCAAVQHAHQKLVVHRDIKPGNILVTASGVPKLLDFGIAKLLLPDDTDGAPRTLTAVGMRLLTPDYASPEQVRGDPVSVATDVYSLGTVLYELLAGKRAHPLKTYTELEMALTICETEVRPPSEVIDDARTRREVAGDLDNIVGLALRKDPARRYASAEQFAGDIRRYLDGLPVLARPETLTYRVQKFVTRNRVPVAAAVLVAASLSGGIVATSLQARRADAQAARAERRFQQVRKLANTFVFEIYDGMVNVPGTAELRARVVTTALEYLDSLAREVENETALQLELAAAYKRIADVQGNPALSGLGQAPAAIASYEKARDVLNRLAASPDPSPQVLSDLANLERTMGFMYLNSGDPSRAIEHQRKSITAWERRTPQRGQDLQSDTGIAQAWGMMGMALAASGEYAAAVQRHTAAVDLLRSWLPRKTAATTQGTLSIMLHHLGDALRETGDLAQAVRTYREAVQIRKQILQKSPTNLSFRRRLFSLNFALASVFGNPLTFNLGNQPEAEGYAAETLREAQAMAKEDRGSNRAVRDLMFGNWIMGCVLLPTDAARAVPHLETALSLAAQSGSGNPDDVLYIQSKANAEEALARALLLTGDRRRAVDLLRRASDALERLSRSAPQMTDYRFDLIRVWNALGDALPAPAAHEFYGKAYLAAGSASPGDRNAWERLNRANVTLRWPRWNPGAPEAERRRMLELALQSWQQLSAQAPANSSLQAALAEVRLSLKPAPRAE